MDINKKEKSQFSKTSMVIMFLLVGLSVFIWYRLRFNRQLDEAQQLEAQKIATVEKFSNLRLDTEVLSDSKFKELRSLPKAAFEPLGGEITAGELQRVARRNSNPFKPF